MSEFLAALKQRVEVERKCEEDRDFWELFGADTNDKLVATAQNDPESVMDTFRNGTDIEFCVLVDAVGEIGSPFDEESTMNEIIRLAEMRNNPGVMEAVKTGYGAMYPKE